MSAGQFPDEQSEEGEFIRQEDAFQDWVKADGSTDYPVEKGRYHLYVCLACPWAHRTIIYRRILGLEPVIGLTAVDPIRDEKGWRFGDDDVLKPDPNNGWKYLSEAYHANDPDYRGRVTVPVLWDKETKRIVSNNEDDIMRMLDQEFREFRDPFTTAPETFYPETLRDEIDRLFEIIYDKVNDGVYKAGFATSQSAYEKHARALFDTLDMLEARLTRQRYLMGPTITEVDWKLFVTIIRFDPVYHGHFKCNLRRIVDYPNLHAWMRDLFQQEGVADTVNFDHIKRHYYVTHDDINPTQVVPIGPHQDLWEPHGREELSLTAATQS